MRIAASSNCSFQITVGKHCWGKFVDLREKGKKRNEQAEISTSYYSYWRMRRTLKLNAGERNYLLRFIRVRKFQIDVSLFDFRANSCSSGWCVSTPAGPENGGSIWTWNFFGVVAFGGKKLKVKYFHVSTSESLSLRVISEREIEVTFIRTSHQDMTHIHNTNLIYQCPGAFYYFRSIRRDTANVLHLFLRKDSSNSDFRDEQVRRHKIIAHQRG